MARPTKRPRAPQLTFPLPEELRESFAIACAARGVSTHAALRALVTAFVADAPRLDNPTLERYRAKYRAKENYRSV